MRKYLLFVCMLLYVAVVHAQYNNEWIDYAKTYYKFTVGKTGLYRISTEALSAAGLSSIPAEQFQLWRNGQQVAMFTSSTSGVLPTGGYLEFWGETNDGSLDDKLYKNPAYHLNPTYSLSSDTAAYFLTVNAGNNLRFENEENKIENNTLPAEPFFLYTYKADYKQKINRGKGFDYGEVIYSSTYDMGEFWSSNDIAGNASVTATASSLNVYTNGPSATLSISAAGNSNLGSNRKITASINGDNNTYINQPLTGYNAALFTANNIPLSIFSSNSAAIKITNVSANTNDRMVAGMVQLTYPHSFNFGGAKTFAFILPAAANDNYLEITNFNFSGSTPVLYDVTNGKRYIANTATPNILKFKLTESFADRLLILVSEDAGNITLVNGLTRRNFVNFGSSANQGDYLVISNKILFAGDNPVEQYRQYRAGASGGSYNAKIYDIDELVDQFAFGIKKHPLSVKNFLQYSRNVFSIQPKYVFLIGKAVTYDEYRMNQSSRHADLLNLVPTFGWPASDAILASNTLDPVAATPIGRLSVINGGEVKIY